MCLLARRPLRQSARHAEVLIGLFLVAHPLVGLGAIKVSLPEIRFKTDCLAEAVDGVLEPFRFEAGIGPTSVETGVTSVNGYGPRKIVDCFFYVPTFLVSQIKVAAVEIRNWVVRGVSLIASAKSRNASSDSPTSE